MGVETDDTCTFCKREKDHIQHIFWNCECVRSFWRQLEQRLNENCVHLTMFKFSEIAVLFGY